MIDELTSTLRDHSDDIAAWIADKTEHLPVPFYASADIRDSGVKVACVDLNIFPAGFNNICNNSALRSICPLRDYLNNYFHDAPFSRVLIIPEAHTRNPFYNSHLSRLQALLEAADLHVDIAMMNSDRDDPATLITKEDEELVLTPVSRTGTRLVDPEGTPYDWILLNNDLSTGPLPLLDGISQPVLPPPCLGWYNRRKSTHYTYQKKVVDELASLCDCDPWLLFPYTEVINNIDFSRDDDRQRVADAVEQLQRDIARKYSEYSVDTPPTVFVKNDSGTYGMGIMVVESPSDILTMNRKSRNKMATGKGKTPITDVVLQEGIPTRTTVKGNVSEEVIYLIGTNVVGAFIRANTARDDMDNLNARGMEFYQYCSLHPVRHHGECMCTREYQYVYYLVAQLGVLAAAYETMDICPEWKESM